MLISFYDMTAQFHHENNNYYLHTHTSGTNYAFTVDIWIVLWKFSINKFYASISNDLYDIPYHAIEQAQYEIF